MISSCACPSCGQSIEFETEDYPAGTMVQCPTCGSEFAPVRSAPQPATAPPPLPPPAASWIQATEKQIAYLSYMGVQGAKRMSKKEASEVIDHLFENIEDPKMRQRLSERRDDWVTDRCILHPGLYADEVNRVLDYELPGMFHTYVRSRVVGASERLTKERIKEVIRSLTQENAQWWHAKNKKEVFYAKLASTYPGCVDGRPPEKEPVKHAGGSAGPPLENRPVAWKQTPTPAASSRRGSGCLVVLCAVIVVTLLILLVALGLPRGSTC